MSERAEALAELVALLTRDNDQLRDALARLEWQPLPGRVMLCPVCKHYRDDGHADDCTTKNALHPTEER